MIPVEKQTASLVPNFTFDSFIKESGNLFAVTAALAVADAPGKAFNPLYIYGPTGLGKTHLLHAIGNEIHSQNPQSNVLYITSDQFQNCYIESIAKNQSGEFVQKLEAVDVLLFDNLEQLAGRCQTQEVLFNLVNHFLDNHRQMVFASVQQAQELSLFDERLRSRMSWGLVTEVAALSAEQVIQEYCNRNQIHLPPDKLDFLVLKQFQNTAELLAGIKQMAVFSNWGDKTVPNGDKQLNGQQIPSELWNKVLAEIKSGISRASFETWFRDTKAVVEDDTLKIICSNDFQKDWLESRYKDLIADSVELLTSRELSLKFVMDQVSEFMSGSVNLNQTETHSESEKMDDRLVNDLAELKRLIQESLYESKKTNSLLEELKIACLPLPVLEDGRLT